MSEEVGVTEKSVAIVAMGPSKEMWIRRMHRNDDPAFFTHVMNGRMGQIVPETEKLREMLLHGFHDLNLDDNQKGWLMGMAEAFSPNEEQREMIAHFTADIGKQATINEVGAPYTHVWGINHMGKVLKGLDMIFAMDDLRVEQHRWETMLTGETPIMSCEAYPEYNSLKYPLSEIVQFLGGEMYLVNSCCYALAYALYEGYTRVGLYGCDFHYPGIEQNEQARSNLEWLIGRAEMMGVKIEIAEGSTVMNRHKPAEFYGFATQPIVDHFDGTESVFDPAKKIWNKRPKAMPTVTSVPEENLLKPKPKKKRVRAK